MVLLACDAPGGTDAAVLADAGALPDAGPRRCTTHARCPEAERCAVGDVGEISVEAGEEGWCRPAAALLGSAAPSHAYRPGGRPLAERLCVAQALQAGAGADALRARQLELLSASGARLVRIHILWSTVQPTRDGFDFSAYDPLVEAATGAGVELLVVLAYGAPWAASATEADHHFPPDDPEDFARYAGEVAARYAGRIRRYEIWNEPNGGYRFWKPTVHGDAAAFAELTARAAASVRAACDDCIISGAGLFFHEQVINGAIEFTQDWLTARPDGLAQLDAFGVHPYPLYPPQAPPEGDATSRAFSGMDDDVRAVLARHGAPPLPLAATELGWPSYGAVDEAQQARWLTRAMLLGAALGWDPLCWYELSDRELRGTYPPEHDFGLYRFGSQDPAQPIDPKPARDALAWLASIGEGARFAGARAPPLHDPEAGRYALDFEGPSGRWTALWSLAPWRASIEAAHRVLDHLGVERGATPGELDIGAEPRFLLP